MGAETQIAMPTTHVARCATRHKGHERCSWCTGHQTVHHPKAMFKFFKLAGHFQLIIFFYVQK